MKTLARSVNEAVLFLELLGDGVVGPDSLAEGLMKALARSVIAAVLFLELSGDDVVDPHSAVRAMENIGYELQGMSEAERTVLRDALDELIVEERSASSPRQAVIKFYQCFMDNCGLEEE
jgi:hypothetical protein